MKIMSWHVIDDIIISLVLRNMKVMQIVKEFQLKKDRYFYYFFFL